MIMYVCITELVKHPQLMAIAQDNNYDVVVMSDNCHETEDSPNLQWSDKLLNYHEEDTLQETIAEIKYWYCRMMAGDVFANDHKKFPLPSPITPLAVKEQLAELYEIEVSDVDIMLKES